MNEIAKCKFKRTPVFHLCALNVADSIASGQPSFIFLLQQFTQRANAVKPCHRFLHLQHAGNSLKPLYHADAIVAT